MAFAFVAENVKTYLRKSISALYILLVGTLWESTSREAATNDRAQPGHTHNPQYRDARSISTSFIRGDLMKKEWEPKTSDCFLVTGGQLKRLRDEPDHEKRIVLLYPIINQKYHSDIEKEGKKLDEQKEQKKLFEVI